MHYVKVAAILGGLVLGFSAMADAQMETATVTTSVDPVAAGSIDLAEIGAGDGLDLPAGTYVIGTGVQATLFYDYDNERYVFDGWTLNGLYAGIENPLSFNVYGPTTLVAHLIRVYALSLSSTEGGTLIAEPAVGPYMDGTIVTLIATPNSDCYFMGWGGANGADVIPLENDGSGIICMNGNKEVMAKFYSIVEHCNGLQLSANPNAGGTVSVSPPENCPWGWITDTRVTITATPNLVDNFRFLYFDGENARDICNISDPDPYTGAVTAELVMDNYKSIVANFLYQWDGPCIELLAGETVAEGWIFGGVVRTLACMDITYDTPIFIDGVQVQRSRVASDYRSIDIVIPPYTGLSQAATVDVDITIGTGTNALTYPNAFRYKRHEENNGVRTTAFIVEDPMVETTFAMTLDGTEDNTTPVILPAMKTMTPIIRVFGIAQNAGAIPETKVHTEAIGILGTGYISTLTEMGEISAGNVVNNAYDFSLHLYLENYRSTSLPPSGFATYVNANGLLDFTRPVDSDGNPNTTASAVEIILPLDKTALTFADVRNGLTVWGVGTVFDYVTRKTTLLNPPTVSYQSELLNNEVGPALTAATPDATQPNVMIARLYSLNGFSLRRSANLTTEMQEGVKLFRRSGANWAGLGTAIGDLNGGLELKIVSPMGGIAWVDRIEFHSVEKCAVIATAKESNFLTIPGSDEYNLVFRTPESNDVGITDMVIFLKSTPEVPAVTLERVFQYTYPKLSIIRETAQRLLGSFYSLDTNADNALSISEARVLVPDLKPCVFNILDKNNDGELSADELEMAASHGIWGCTCQKSTWRSFDIRKSLGDLLLFGMSALLLMSWSAFRRN